MAYLVDQTWDSKKFPRIFSRKGFIPVMPKHVSGFTKLLFVTKFLVKSLNVGMVIYGHPDSYII